MKPEQQSKIKRQQLALSAKEKEMHDTYEKFISGNEKHPLNPAIKEHGGLYNYVMAKRFAQAVVDVVWNKWRSGHYTEEAGLKSIDEKIIKKINGETGVSNHSVSIHKYESIMATIQEQALTND